MTPQSYGTPDRGDRNEMLQATYVGWCDDESCDGLHGWVHDDCLEDACPDAEVYDR
jgi:hypothetical protein